MEIANTLNYQNLTARLRRPDCARNIKFGAEGFSYLSESLAFVLTRVSKNNYCVDAIFNLKKETFKYESQEKAISACVKLVELDKRGALR